MTEEVSREAAGRPRRCKLSATFPLLLLLLTCGSALAQREAFTPAKPLSGSPGPTFPEKANEAAIAGSVVFQARITPEGHVEAVTVLSVPANDLGFEEAIEETVSKWKFEPARSDGAAVVGTYVGRIAFRLNAVAERRLQEIVTALFRDSRRVDVVSALLDDELGHTHTGDGLIVGPGNAAAKLAEILDGDTSSVSIDSFRYLNEELVLVDAKLESSAGVSRNAEVYGLKREADWGIAHAAIVPDWNEIDDSRIEPPNKTENESPSYPRHARDNGIEGKAVIEFIIDRDGRVSDVLRLSGAGLFAEPLERALQKWRYEPALFDGEPIPVYMLTECTYTFKARDDLFILIVESLGAIVP